MNIADLGIGWSLNQFGVLDDETYGYYKESAIKRVIKESISIAPEIEKISRNVNDFIAGGAVAANNNFYSGALQTLSGYEEVIQPDSVAFKFGKLTGDAASLIAGAVTVVGGTLGEIGGFALNATGAGAVAGVPINIASTGAIVYGGAVTASSAKGLVSYGLFISSCK